MQARVSEIADALIDGFSERGRADVAAELAVALPMRVIAEQLGVGDGDLDAFKRWSDDLVFAVGNDNPGPEDVMRITRSLVEISDFFRAAFEDRRRNPRNDFVTVLATAEDPEWTPTDEHRIAIISQMLGAGNETATKMITSGIARLAHSPELASRLRGGDETLVKAFVEEMLRIDSPVQGLYRATSTDTVLEGVPIPAGSSVWVVFASGNRDEAVFPRPEELDVDRANVREHLAFGRGIHFCPGAPLARMEGFVAFSTMLERVYPWTIEDYEMEHSYVLNGYRRLDISFEPTPARRRSAASVT
jgi:cytochrome P450